MNVKELREKVMEAIYDNIDLISEHLQCEAIIRFMCPDLYDFGDYDEIINELVEQELEEYCENYDLPRLTENNYDDVWDDCRCSLMDRLTISEYDINGKYLFWLD